MSNNTGPAQPALVSSRTGWLRTALRFLSRFAQRPLSLIALIIVGMYIVIALFGPMLAPYDYAASTSDPNNCITSGSGRVRCAALRNAPPSEAHLFGTDRNGRDIFSRILTGARETIGLPTFATLFAVILGTLLGLLAGYVGGWLDEILARMADALLAIPALVLAIVAVGTIVPALENVPGPFVNAIGPTNVALILVITLLYTPIVLRVIRSATLALRDRGYVEAARLRGETTFYILTREILPSILPALVVEASLRFSYAIFLVASLGFLGLGAQPPSSEWGRMVLDGRDNALTAPWTLWYPVAAIASLIISVNLVSDALRRIFRYEDATH